MCHLICHKQKDLAWPFLKPKSSLELPDPSVCHVEQKKIKIPIFKISMTRQKRHRCATARFVVRLLVCCCVAARIWIRRTGLVRAYHIDISNWYKARILRLSS